MTFRQEAASWAFPTKFDTAPTVEVGQPAPSTDTLPMPEANGRPVVITFLRHCGCPFAEKSFRRLHGAATAHPEISFIAVSHSSAESTDKWLKSLSLLQPSTQVPNLRIIVDDTRELYAAWGVGPSSLWHVLNPFSMWNVFKLGKEEGIWNRPTETGSRWQMSGSWAVDGKGVVRWGGASKSADDVADVEEGVKALA